MDHREDHKYQLAVTTETLILYNTVQFVEKKREKEVTKCLRYELGRLHLRKK